MPKNRSTRWRWRSLAFALVALATPASAGPWTKNLGEVYAKVGQGAFIAGSFRDASGATIDGADYLGLTTSAYFEVGVFSGVHVQGFVPYIVAINTFDDGGRFTRGSGGDAIVAVQASPPLSLPLPVAARVAVKIPMYEVSAEHGAGATKGLLDTRFPAPGDGQLDVTFWLSAGGSLTAIPMYGFLELGYRHRTGAFIGATPGEAPDYADGIALSAQLGYTFGKRVLVAVGLNGVLTPAADEVTKSYLTLGPSLFVPIAWDLAAEASFDPVIYAKNSAQGVGFSVGLSYRR